MIAAATFLMLLVIVPVIAATLIFAFRYRLSNPRADYAPDWHHSTRLEFLIWGAPLCIVALLGTITWISTHELDPYRPLDRVDAQHALVPGAQPLVIEVVALDWKWLFVYPQLGIATVNEAAAPVDRPVEFRITSQSVMNAFSVPAVAGMVYAMPGMQTRLNAVVNVPGTYQGFSSNYSGAGFSNMRFRLLGLSNADFDAWVARSRASSEALDRDTYLKLAQPSEREPVRHYAKVDPTLYDTALHRSPARDPMDGM